MAIIFSMKPASGMSAEDAIEHLRTHLGVAWGSNFRIDLEKFMVSSSNPLTGYINYEGKIRYEVNIIEIIRYRSEQHYPNNQERPNKDGWIAAQWKTFFRINQFEEIGPIDTTSFKKVNGENVKHPIKNYVEVLDI